MKKIRAVVVRVGEQPVAEMIDPSLAAMQAFVGGYIELVYPGGDFVIVCNEDAVALDLPQNGWGILGPYFLCRNRDDGELGSLTETEAHSLQAMVIALRGVRHAGARWMFQSFNSLEEMADFLEQARADAARIN